MLLALSSSLSVAMSIPESDMEDISKFGVDCSGVSRIGVISS